MSDDDTSAATAAFREAEARLVALGARIERLAIKPAELSAARPWLRIAKPFLRLFRVRPHVRTKALRSLLASLHELDAAAEEQGTARAIEARKGALPKATRAALDELEASIATAERAAIVDGPGAHGPLAGWLTRLHEVTRRSLLAASPSGDPTAREAALQLDAEWALTPLTILPEGKKSAEDRGDGKPGTSADSAVAGAGDDRATTSAPASQDAPWEDDPRVVEIELAAIDRVLDAARSETHFLGRRRRLFESARKLLLDASAALPLDPAAVHGRAQHIADQIVLANRWQAAGVSPDVALPYQAVTAIARGERERLYATLSAAFSVACCDGDVALATRAREALSRMEGATQGSSAGSRDASTARSASELLGDPTVGAIRDAYESARRELAFAKLAPGPTGEDAAEMAQRQDLWDRYLHGDAVLATLSAAVSADGCFEVGGTLAPVRVEEETRRVRVVSYPTQDLLFVPTGDATDLPSSVIEDPRAVILALAEGRLLARKFRKVETVRTSRTRLTSEARIYVLDASDSMLLGTSGRAAGARARMRDAILLAELATLYRRATEGARGTRVVLFYRYFTKSLGAVARVATASEAIDAMAQVVATPRHGGTDIEAALLASFAQIREAREGDRDLARAQIVLVTDGEAAVDEAVILAAREKEGDFPIGVSVIALGEENPVLRRLVARQRARGEPAFYHFVSDSDLAAIVSGRRAGGAPVHATDRPGVTSGDATPPSVVELTGELRALIDEIDALDRKRAADRGGASFPWDTMGTADAASLAAVGVTHVETEAERARREAACKDERSLSARFDAWFPEPRAPHEPAIPTGDFSAAADADAALVVLATLTDLLRDLGGTPAERRADAIELLERLLPDARLSPARYRVVVFAPDRRIARGLASVRAAAAATTASDDRASAASPSRTSRRRSR